MSTIPTKAAAGAGTVLSMSATSNGTFVPVAQIKTFQFTNPKWSFADITNLNSPAVGVGVQEEAKPTKVNPGELAANGVYLPSDPGQELVATAFSSGAQYYFKLQCVPVADWGQTTTGNLFAFQGFVQELPLPDFDPGKEQAIKFSIKLNSTITVTLGS